MTIAESEIKTENPAAEENPEAAQPVSEAASEAAPDLSPVIFGTADNKYIGRLWMVSALFFGLIAFVFAILLSLQQSGTDIFDGTQRLSALFSTYRVLLIFLFLVPVFIGLATYIVPSQVGARSLVFPRLALGAFWTWAASSVVFVVAWGFDGGLAPGGKQELVELSILSFALIVIAILGATLSIVATILASRSEGLSLWRLPMFSWSILVAGVLWLLSLPVLLANLLLMWVDIRGEGAALYGLGENLYDQVAWVFSQPQVFMFALPLLGILGDSIIGSTGKKFKFYAEMQILIALIGVVTYGAEAQEFFFPQVSENPVFVAAGLLLFVFSLALLGGWLYQLKGRIRKINEAVILAVAAVLLFMAAAATAALNVMGDFLDVLSNFGSDNVQYQESLADFLDPLFGLKGSVTGNSVLHLVFAAGLLGVMAGAHYWSPQLFKRRLGLLSGLSLALLSLLGAALWAGGDIAAGFWEQPELPSEQVNFLAPNGVDAVNAISLAGVIIVVLAFLLFVARILKTILDNKKVEPDQDLNPFGAHSLEWTEEYAAVNSAYPLWQEEEQQT